MNEKKMAILGAGLTGLCIRYFLSQKGVDVETLEKNSECGGLCRSMERDGFTFDYGGSHIIFSKDEEVLQFMTGLLGDNKIKNKRNAKILFKDRYVKYPFENGLSDLPKQDNFECLYYFIQLLIRKERSMANPKNLKEWCYWTFGKGIAEKYLIPYNEKIWNFPSEKMGLEWVERIPNPPPKDIIKSSLGIETEGYVHQLYFYYPKKGGIQSLIHSLIERGTGKISTNFKVSNIKREGKKWIVSDGNSEKSYDRIISTIPLPDLVHALNDVPKAVLNAVDNLKYNSIITVMLGLNRKVTDISWLYIPEKDILFHRVSFPSNYSPYVTPNGKSSVLAEITCNVGDEIWKMGNQELIEQTIEDLSKLKILCKSDVCFEAVKRLKYAYVVNDLEYQNNIETVRNYVEGIGIDLVGRFSEFEYLNMDACIRHAMDFVKESLP